MNIFEIVGKVLIGIISVPFMFIGMIAPISFLFVLIDSYIKVKKIVIREIDERFVVNDRDLLMKKSRQIGFVSLIISTSMLIIFYFFMDLFFNFFRVSSTGEIYTDDFTPMIVAGFCIAANGFLGFMIAKILIKREIKKYFLQYENNI
ncbi:MAG: hypothetical protein WC087_02425 [Candidatus Paceibacterota bacterium]